MTFATLDLTPVINTQEEIFLGLRVEWVPPLNFQVQMDHGKPFSDAMRKRINFGPLVKQTPFEKEKRLKEMVKEPPTLTTKETKEVTTAETEVPPIKKVAFCDEPLPFQSLTGFSNSLNKLDQNRQATSLKELATEKSVQCRSFPKGILKSRVKSKYTRQFSNQSGSQQSKNISTQLSYSPKERKLSIFAKYHELHMKDVQSESDDYSEDSIKSIRNFSEENLDPLVELYRFSNWVQKGSPAKGKTKF